MKQEFVDYLTEAGYDPNRMSAMDWNEEGYYEFALDSRGRRLEIKNWRKWRSQEHYLWLVDNWLDRWGDD